eukprot:CAMPEP_0119524636 /NCGR_PEP_ID=MMETSP1344-20130328/39548_1 /TAXON_ID=236787 /ORGANISM="Florenciella parvula, Strain CCMP2471" /LENGTH=60 /DNA_ID=CAMNT_0007563195 /DNA_START=98 /DNA_END=277 /DNA_ORIENTATION=+
MPRTPAHSPLRPSDESVHPGLTDGSPLQPNVAHSRSRKIEVPPSPPPSRKHLTTATTIII